LSDTLDKYGISIEDVARGELAQAPVIPGLTAPKPPAQAQPIVVTPAPPTQ
jgi:outer membrane protein